MLIVREPGFLNTVQDAGRWGYQAYGVPVAGAMDLYAWRAANGLVGNSVGDAAIEIHSELVVDTDSPHLCAVTGAEASIEVNGRALAMWTSFFVRGGARLEIHLRAGAWAYLAIHGGVDVPRVLGSRSTYLRGGLGGLSGRALAAGDAIPVGQRTLSDLVKAAGERADDVAISHARRRTAVRVQWGPHEDRFTEAALETLVRGKYRVTESADRMGYRLEGEMLVRRDEGELISCGVPLGAIQVPPNGQPIVLMADHQTTGGYPIIATVLSEDIPMVAQTRSGETLSFAVIDG